MICPARMHALTHTSLTHTYSTHTCQCWHLLSSLSCSLSVPLSSLSWSLGQGQLVGQCEHLYFLCVCIFLCVVRLISVARRMYLQCPGQMSVHQHVCMCVCVQCVLSERMSTCAASRNLPRP